VVDAAEGCLGMSKKKQKDLRLGKAPEGNSIARDRGKMWFKMGAWKVQGVKVILSQELFLQKGTG